MKLIILDADGILSKGEAEPFDLSLFARLRDLNHRARHDPAIPAVTLNTGRPSPYVEAVMQAIDGWQPALYESGGGLYFPQSYQFQTAPQLTSAQKEQLQTVIRRLDEKIVQPGKAYWQPGKTVCYSLFAPHPLTISDLIPEVEAIVQEISSDIVVTLAVLALNIQPVGIDKGTGLRWLAEVTSIEPAEMAGAGDSDADVDFLQLVGYPAAPANATEPVKAVAQFISPQADAAGLHEILDYWLT